MADPRPKVAASSFNTSCQLVLQSIPVPSGLELDKLPVKAEVKHRLREARPRTLGDAQAIPGITEADLATLASFCARTTGNVSRETFPHEEPGDD